MYFLIERWWMTDQEKSDLIFMYKWILIYPVIISIIIVYGGSYLYNKFKQKTKLK